MAGDTFDTAGDTKQRVPLPPMSATENQISCEYCPVACSYKVYSWPVGIEGGPGRDENALRVDHPQDPLTGRWVSTNQHTTVIKDGVETNVIIVPDADMTTVNVGGTHSVRGGTLAQKLYNPNSPTSDRLKVPLVRIGGNLQAIPWDLATDLVADIGNYVITNHGKESWGMKRYSYQFFENTYALTKLAYYSVGSANHAPHHVCAEGTDTPGLDDCGFDAFPAAFEDYKEADVVMFVGTDPYETKTVVFTTWVTAGSATPIVIDPRKTFTANWAVQRGGLHLQLTPGTDTLLMNSIARHILDQGWEDTAFINAYAQDNRTEFETEEAHWRRLEWGQTLTEFKAYIQNDDRFRPADASALCGVPQADIERAAELLTGGSGAQPKTLIAFEKGCYWSHNYENTAACGNLAILTGASGEPGRAVTRMGGHQRGGMSAASYPKADSPHEFTGTSSLVTWPQKVEMDQDRWTVQGNTRFMWVIGMNWIGASAGSQNIANMLATRVQAGEQPTSISKADILTAWQNRVDAGGMVMVHQECYQNDTSDYADLILPAAMWGEDDFTRMNAERRIRVYDKIADPPGEAKPDWQIIKEVALKMGYPAADYSWSNTTDIFEETVDRGRPGGRKDYTALVEYARTQGMTGHEFIRSKGNTGFQLPAVEANGGASEPSQTVRMFENKSWKTSTGKLNFVRPDWDAVLARNNIFEPGPGEVWVTSSRVNHLWNNLSDSARRPYTIKKYPANYLEINPTDATTWGVESGDMVAVNNPAVLSHDGSTTSGYFTAVAWVTDEVPPGLTCAYFHYPGSWANSVVPADTTQQAMNLRYNFKLGKGTVTRLGESEFKETMSFVPRNLF